MICGIDLGSRDVKIVVMQQDAVVKAVSYDTIAFYRKYAFKNDGELVIDFNALNIPACKSLVSTGYGRLIIKVADSEVIPEIKAHHLGAMHQCGLDTFTLLDLGGQDSKIISIKDGKMIDFDTNDKCAASSGRYLENMARVLGINLEELSKHHENPVELNSTCAVFGESELIGKIVEGYSVDSMAAGVNYSIFKRIQPILRRMHNKIIVFTGGVAKNKALVEIIKKELKVQVVVPAMPQYNGAIGCCIYGRGVTGGF